MFLLQHLHFNFYVFQDVIAQSGEIAANWKKKFPFAVQKEAVKGLLMPHRLVSPSPRFHYEAGKYQAKQTFTSLNPFLTSPILSVEPISFLW